MYHVRKSIGAKRRQPTPRFESAEIPDWLLAIHAREKMLAEGRLKAISRKADRIVGLNDDLQITHEGVDTDENEPSE